MDNLMAFRVLSVVAVFTSFNVYCTVGKPNLVPKCGKAVSHLTLSGPVFDQSCQHVLTPRTKLNIAIQQGEETCQTYVLLDEHSKLHASLPIGQSSTNIAEFSICAEKSGCTSYAVKLGGSQLNRQELPKHFLQASMGSHPNSYSLPHSWCLSGTPIEKRWDNSVMTWMKREGRSVAWMPQEVNAILGQEKQDANYLGRTKRMAEDKRSWDNSVMTWIKRNPGRSFWNKNLERKFRTGRGEDLSQKKWDDSIMGWMKRNMADKRWEDIGMEWMKRYGTKEDEKRSWDTSAMTWMKRNADDNDYYS